MNWIKAGESRSVGCHHLPSGMHSPYRFQLRSFNQDDLMRWQILGNDFSTNFNYFSNARKTKPMNFIMQCRTIELFRLARSTELRIQWNQLCDCIDINNAYLTVTPTKSLNFWMCFVKFYWIKLACVLEQKQFIIFTPN